MKNTFECLRVNEVGKEFIKSIEQKTFEDLPQGDILVRVAYSSLNYKDVFSSIGNKGVTKNYPHTPGIDAVGEIVESNTAEYKKGDWIIVTGFDLGMNTWGGFSQYIRIPKQWVIRLPKELEPLEAMIYGTAGFTAAQCIDKIIQNVYPQDGSILVTGATGGVGSMSIAMLSKLGYDVYAITGKDKNTFLNKIGAKKIINRKEFSNKNDSPLLKGVYAGAIDTLGGVVLENIIKSVQLYGSIACCGNLLGATVNTNIYPFILRGVTLYGISSQNCSIEKRKELWNKLATHWKPSFLKDMYTQVSLQELPSKIESMREATMKGRVVVKL